MGVERRIPNACFKVGTFCVLKDGIPLCVLKGGHMRVERRIPYAC